MQAPRSTTALTTVYPRAGGVLSVPLGCGAHLTGSSPRVRGTERLLAFPRIRIGLPPRRLGTGVPAGRSWPGLNLVRAANTPIVPPTAECFWCNPDRAGKRQISAKQRVVKEVYPRPLEGIAVSVQPVLNGLPRARCVRGTGLTRRRVGRSARSIPVGAAGPSVCFRSIPARAGPFPMLVPGYAVPSLPLGLSLPTTRVSSNLTM